MADGCPSKNKNTAMSTMCHKWLDNHATDNITEIELMYPVVGHSFLPPDRVFGLIEKETRKLEVIADPNDYREIFSNYSSVVNVGEGDCAVFDWKTEGKQSLKATKDWHFKISKSKIITLRKSVRSGNVLTGRKLQT